MTGLEIFLWIVVGGLGLYILFMLAMLVLWAVVGIRTALALWRSFD